jgi:eukaryotic-like serine/threonine-protein kinase
VTHVGDGARAEEPNLDTSPEALLAERYALDEHINNDGAGRDVWRGVDVVLRRPVAIVMRAPGGESAEEMLTAAVKASRVRHPNLIGVYDAIDEGTRAYVVREWIDGAALRELVADEGQLDAERTTAVLSAVAQAVAALHASGMAHGNIHPGTVLVAHDGRVVLTDAKDEPGTTPEGDMRALGASGYFMLTGYWPRGAGRAPAGIPDCRRDQSGSPVAPRQIRAGVPTYLDDLVMDLLNRDLAAPLADVLAAELSRLDTSGEQLLFGEGPATIRFAATEEPVPPAHMAIPKVAMVSGVALAAAIAGMVLGVKVLNAKTDADHQPSVTQSTHPGKPRPVALTAAQVRIVDPKGDRKETKNSALVVDGDPATGWKSNGYTKSNFGGSKPGMGILIKLDSPQRVASVKVQLSLGGATAQLLTGSSDPGDTSAGDGAILETYHAVGDAQVKAGTTMVFPTDLSTPYQYLLVWFTDLPLENAAAANPYKIGVQEITVEVQ